MWERVQRSRAWGHTELTACGSPVMQDQLLKNKSVTLRFTSCLSLGLTTLTDADDKRKATITKKSLASRGNTALFT